MKKILLIVLGFLTYSSSQSQDYKEKLANKVCECVNSKKDISLLNFSDKCIKNNDFYTQVMLEEYKNGNIKKLIDSIKNNNKGEDFAYKLGQEISEVLMLKCQKFSNLLLAERERSIDKHRKEITEKELDVLNNRNSILLDFLFDRGVKNFAYKNYDLAIKDLEKIRKYYPDFTGTYYFLGWVYERKGNYVKSLKYYNTALEYSDNSILILTVKMIERKIKLNK